MGNSLNLGNLAEAAAFGAGRAFARDATTRMTADGVLEPPGKLVAADGALALVECQHCGQSHVEPVESEFAYPYCPHCGNRLLPYTGETLEEKDGRD